MSTLSSGNKMKSASWELENSIVEIGRRIETLSGIESLFNTLVNELDEATKNDHSEYSIREISIKLNVVYEYFTTIVDELHGYERRASKLSIKNYDYFHNRDHEDNPDSPIENLKKNMRAEIQVRRENGVPDEELVELVDSYIRAIDTLSEFYSVRSNLAVEDILNLKE